MPREITVEVGQLFEACREALSIERISDWGSLDRKITRPRIQKAGLALSGYTKHVFPDRLQILGLTEIDYLLSIPLEQAVAGLDAYCGRGLCGLLLTRGLEPPDFLVEAARRHKIPLFCSQSMSSTVISTITNRLEDMMAPRTHIHGVLVDVFGIGLLLIGRSGVGKSEAALDLILKGHRLVADDVVEVTVRQPAVWGAATELHQHHMEIRGMGILNITSLFGVAAVRDTKKIEVVVELSMAHDADYDRLGTETEVWPIIGVDVPLVRMPLRPGRNIAALIEVIARNQILKYRGHDSAREFQEMVNARIAATTGTGIPEAINRSSSAPNPGAEVE